MNIYKNTLENAKQDCLSLIEFEKKKADPDKKFIEDMHKKVKELNLSLTSFT